MSTTARFEDELPADYCSTLPMLCQQRRLQWRDRAPNECELYARVAIALAVHDVTRRSLVAEQQAKNFANFGLRAAVLQCYFYVGNSNWNLFASRAAYH
jgi:hypothetical protein